MRDYEGPQYHCKTCVPARGLRKETTRRWPNTLHQACSSRRSSRPEANRRGGNEHCRLLGRDPSGTADSVAGDLLRRVLAHVRRRLRLDRIHALRGEAFFDNGGRRCYITRVVGAGAVKVAAILGDFTVTAIGPGATYNQVLVRMGPGTTKNEAGDPVGFRLQVDYWADQIQVPTDDEGIGATAARPTLSEEFDDLSVDPASSSYFKKLVNNFNSSLVQIEAAVGVALPAAASALLSNGADGAPVTPAS